MFRSASLNEIAAFVAVVDSGSYAAAGDSLHLPDDEIERRVAELADRTEVVLFHDARKGAYLTQPAREALPYARSVLARCAQLADHLDRGGSKQRRERRRTRASR